MGAIILSLLVALIPWFFWPGWPTRDPMTDLKWPVAMAEIAIFFLAVLIGRSRAMTFELGGRFPLFVGTALILIGLILSSLRSPAPEFGWRISLREALFIFFACGIGCMVFELKAGRLFAAAYLISAVLQAVLTLRQYTPEGSGARLAGRASMIGTFGNPEYAANWIAPALAIALLRAFSSHLSLKSRIFHSFASLAISVSILISGGRGAALAVLLSVLTIAVIDSVPNAAPSPTRNLSLNLNPNLNPNLYPNRLRLAFFILLPVFLILISTLFLPSSALPSRLADMFNPYSISVRHRLGLVIVTSRMIADHPISGCGPGRFGAAFDQTRGQLARKSSDAGPWAFNEIMNDQSAAEAHCDYLQWWAEYGLLPFFGLILMIASSIGNLIARIRTPPDDSMAKILLAALLTLVISMMFSFPLHRPDRAILFWTLIGLAHAQSKLRDDNEPASVL
ncbi:O-antigen ligase family protein [Candidatus Sumerlaeota bacterium]|nr:O-antigen ligase family protein [Candidatus Sumerlaeota bacterium]